MRKLYIHALLFGISYYLCAHGNIHLRPLFLIAKIIYLAISNLVMDGLVYKDR